MTSGNIPTLAELRMVYGDVGTSLVQAPRPTRRGRTTGITAFVSERIVDLLSEVCGAERRRDVAFRIAGPVSGS
jgi:hypothetical protein